VSQPSDTDIHQPVQYPAVAVRRILVLLQLVLQGTDLYFHLNNVFLELVDLLFAVLQFLPVLLPLLLFFLLFDSEKRAVALAHGQRIHLVILNSLTAAYSR